MPGTVALAVSNALQHAEFTDFTSRDSTRDLLVTDKSAKRNVQSIEAVRGGKTLDSGLFLTIVNVAFLLYHTAIAGKDAYFLA